MTKLEARCTFIGVIKENVFYEVLSLDYERQEILIYTQNDKSDFLRLSFKNVLELRFKKESLFD